MDFLNYSTLGAQFKYHYLGGKKTFDTLSKIGIKLIYKIRLPAIEALKNSKRFTYPMPIEKIAEMTHPFLSVGNQYGEGWLLTGEMLELLNNGINNIVCIQPFGCQPNHVVGKGVIKTIKKSYKQANIAAIDYDPGASEVNQLNRIKLMLSAAENALKEEK